MRILVIGLNYSPDPIGIAKYTSELCEDLAKQGHEVEVVTAPPYYPAWRVPTEYRRGRRRREVVNGVKLWRVPIYVPAAPSGLTRLLHLSSFALSALGIALSRAAALKPNLVLCVAPAIFSAPVALAAARRAKASSWLHIQDFELDAAFDLGLLKNSLGRRLGLGLERKVLGAFDKVSSISPNMIGRLVQKGVARNRAYELRNWADTDVVGRWSSSNTAYRRQLGIQAKTPVLLYSGNMSAKQGLNTLAAAAMLLCAARPDCIILLCGNGPGRSELERHCAGLENVRFMDLQPAERMPELLATADVHLLPQRAEAADLVLPSKLSPMLASGRPIVAMAAPGTGLAMELEGAGIAVLPDDPEAFVEALVQLVDNPLLRECLGVAARERALARWKRSAIIDAFGAEISRNMEPPSAGERRGSVALPSSSGS